MLFNKTIHFHTFSPQSVELTQNAVVMSAVPRVLYMKLDIEFLWSLVLVGLGGSS